MVVSVMAVEIFKLIALCFLKGVYTCEISLLNQKRIMGFSSAKCIEMRERTTHDSSGFLFQDLRVCNLI